MLKCSNPVEKRVDVFNSLDSFSFIIVQEDEGIFPDGIATRKSHQLKYHEIDRHHW